MSGVFEVRDKTLIVRFSRIRSVWLRAPAVILSAPFLAVGQLALCAWMVILVAVFFVWALFRQWRSGWRVIRGLPTDGDAK